MLAVCSSLRSSMPPGRWRSRRLRAPAVVRLDRRIGVAPWSPPSSSDGEAVPVDYDPSGDLLGFEVDSHHRNVVPGAAKLRSWFGPNGQYIRELPCPSCRGRGYTPCTECGIERSRSDCSQCNGKGFRTCRQCLGDCVIWEESIDEIPWEKARSSSPLKVKEDDDVDKLDIKVNVPRKSKRIYQSPSQEVSLKISRSLRTLNAKTGLFSKRMKIIHRDPILNAQRVAAIKKAKGSAAARKLASETMKAFFSDPENREKRSIAMQGVKFYCSHCGKEGHRRHYCPAVRTISGAAKFRCRLCGKRGHNSRTCGSSGSGRGIETNLISSRHCGNCGRYGHNRRTCPEINQREVSSVGSESSIISPSKSAYSCSLCSEKGHNSRTCPKKKAS